MTHIIAGKAVFFYPCGASGRSTPTGGPSADTFLYNGNNLLIRDYSPIDTISTSNVTYSNYSVIGNDVIVNFGSGNTLTLLGCKDKMIHFTGSSTAPSTVYSDPCEKVFTRGDTADNMCYIADTAVVTINASKLTKGLVISGNGNDNHVTGTARGDELYGAAGNDSLYGGSGNDLLSGDGGGDYLSTGAGKDTVVYLSGDDTIGDYTAGQDVIELTSGVELTGVEIPRKAPSNLVFSTSNGGSITVVNGIKRTPQKITIVDGSGNATRQVYGQKALTIVNGDGEVFDLSNGLNDEVIIADASRRAAKEPVVLKGNSKINTLTGGRGADTIAAVGGGDWVIAGAGDDVISLAGGANTVSYTAGQGNDTIYGYTATDRLLLATKATKVKKTQYSAGNLELSIGKGTLTIANISSETAVTVADYAGAVETVSGAAASTAAFEERWFLDTPEVRTAELEDLVRQSDEPAIVSCNEQRVLSHELSNDPADDLASNSIQIRSRLIKQHD